MTDYIPPASGSPEPWVPPHSVPAQPTEQVGSTQPTDHISTPPADSPWAAPLAGDAPTTHTPALGDVTVADATSPMAAHYPQATAGELATAEYVQLGTGEATKPHRGRRRAVFVSASTALLLLIGVGAYAGVRAWTGAGTAEPETAMPASVSAFARVDLNPGFGDKRTVNGLVKKFPTLGSSTTDLVTKLETEISKDAGLNYATDIKPWFGGQAGVGLWADAKGKPVALIALASKDDAKADATLTRLRQSKGADSFGFTMEKGYALVAGSDGDMQAAAAAAGAAAKTASLADNATYQATVAHLGGGNLLVAYADLGKLSSLATGAAQSMLGSLGGGDPNTLGGLGGLGGLGLGSSDGSKLTGQLAIGGKITGDGIEVRAHVQGMKSGTSGTKIMSTLEALPSATVAGISFNGIDPSSDAAKALSTALGAMAGGATSSGAGTDPLGGDPSGNSQAFQSLISGVITPLLTAKVLTAAFTGIGADQTPGVLINVQERDAATATSLVAAIKQMTGGASPAGLKITQNGASIEATVGSPATGGSLGSSELFKTTMAGMSDSTAAAYVDVQKLIAVAGRDISANDRKEWAPVKSIGFGESSSGSGADLLLRVVIK